MKNTIKFLAILLIALTFQSCGDDDNPIDDNPATESYYKVYVDGALFTELSDATASILNGDIATGNQIDFAIFVNNVPEIGETVDVDLEAWLVAESDGDYTLPMVWMSGDNVDSNQARMFSGSITRESKFKVTFTGIYKELILEGPSHTFSGEIVVETVINY